MAKTDIVMVTYTLTGQIPIEMDSPTYEKVREAIDSGEVPDALLLAGIERTDAFGIEADAIEIQCIQRFGEAKAIWEKEQKAGE